MKTKINGYEVEGTVSEIRELIGIPMKKVVSKTIVKNDSNDSNYGKSWKEYEDNIVKATYLNPSNRTKNGCPKHGLATELLNFLPGRSKSAILARASYLGLAKKI